jgi:hypothetical protein
MVESGMTDAEAAAIPVSKFSRDVLQPDLFQSILNDPDAPIVQAMRANETYDWTPRTPLRMYYTPADLVVSPMNTLLALERMHARGAQDVEAIPLVGLKGEALTHGLAQTFAYIAARRWFDTFAAPADVVDDDSDER